jgi:hypothetical protein
LPSEVRKVAPERHWALPRKANPPYRYWSRFTGEALAASWVESRSNTK